MKEKLTVPNIQNFWIKLLPNADDFSQLVIQVFKDGLESVKCFERWSRHVDLENYANALEDWDELVGDDWNEPDSPYLDPTTWIRDHETQISHQDKVRELVESAYSKAEQFIQRFQAILEIYWRNKQFDIDILIDELTQNPVDALSNTLKLLKYH